ncbi:MAG: GNAT family N-acetyltransferase [Pseudomonadota bacterium]
MINNLQQKAASTLQLNGHFEWLNADELAHAHDWWDIYTQSFPLAERDTKQQLILSLHKNIALIGCYRLQNSMAAIVVLYRMQAPAFAFLHYFAVAKAWRNKSLGSKLFPTILTEADKFVLENNQETLGLIWEVEDPTVAQTEQDRYIQIKRINFYERLGGKVFNSKFIQPAINNQNTVPMQLMYHSTKKKLSEQAIAAAIYFQKYQVINGTDTQQLNDLLNLCYTNNPD